MDLTSLGVEFLLNRHFLKYRKDFFQPVLTSKNMEKQKPPAELSASQLDGMHRQARSASRGIRGSGAAVRSKSEDFGWVQRVTELKVELRWIKCSCQFFE